MNIMQSGCQSALQLIIFQRTCTPAIVFWAYSYPSHLILGVLVKFSDAGLSSLCQHWFKPRFKLV